MYTMLRAGDKISINSSALANPELIRAGGEIRQPMHRGFYRREENRPGPVAGVFTWRTQAHRLDAVEWATRASVGRGELVLNSIDADGTKAGLTSRSPGVSASRWAFRWWRAAVRASWSTCGSIAGRQSGCCPGREYFPFWGIHRGAVKDFLAAREFRPDDGFGIPIGSSATRLPGAVWRFSRGAEHRAPVFGRRRQSPAPKGTPRCFGTSTRQRFPPLQVVSQRASEVKGVALRLPAQFNNTSLLTIASTTLRARRLSEPARQFFHGRVATFATLMTLRTELYELLRPVEI